MHDFTRRRLLQGTAALGGLGMMSPFMNRRARAAEMMFTPEEGAKLTFLRVKRFVQSEEDAFLQVLADFTAKTGVTVEVQNESIDDVQPKASVAANVGQGPDLVWGLYSLPHLFPDALLDLTDVATHLGATHGGWVPEAEKIGKSGDKWIGVPLAFNGNYINYRISSVKAAGFDAVPADNEGFLELMKAMKANGTPGGFALGHATGDGNVWVHWALWSHGATMVDAGDNVVINSAETRAACEYVKRLYDEGFAEGTVAWNDGSNNKAFLGGEIHLTNNGISIYAAAVRDGMTDLAADIDHAFWPIGPAGRPTELQVAYPVSVFGYTPYPNAAKALIEYLLSPDGYNIWLQGAVGYWTHPLNNYDSHPVWTEDPKRTVFKDAAKRTLTPGYPGSIGERAAAAIAEFVVLDMFANYATGRLDLEESVKQAERQAKRIYR